MLHDTSVRLTPAEALRLNVVFTPWDALQIEAALLVEAQKAGSDLR